MEEMSDWMKEGERGIRTLIGRDFNARTRVQEGEVIDEEEEERMGRQSKDEKLNEEGRILVRRLEEVESIFNREVEGDEMGEFTYVGSRGQSIIDYIIGNGQGGEEDDSRR